MLDRPRRGIRESGFEFELGSESTEVAFGLPARAVERELA